ncbi:MAG: Rpn family recombination-promoting nuclease/putative transposase [Cytophagales bacterium]|nr:Rpn family recombination-promoting nuclease/putative transposase [Cytophagales bacterium]
MQPTSKQKINQAYAKASLSRQEVAIDFLKGHLPKKLLDMIDLESLELIKESFIDDFSQYHDDVTYKAKINGKVGLIYILIELVRQEVSQNEYAEGVAVASKPYYRLLGATPVTVGYQAGQGNRTKVLSQNGKWR